MELKGFKININLIRQTDGNMPNDYYDFSKYAQIGFGQTLPLDDTLDTMSIQLVGLPFRQEFAPTSMFRVTISQEFYDEETEESGSFNKVYDYCLQDDDVEQPNMAEELYTHNLVLINPAIIAQRRSIDNISVTYKLQDVELEESNALIIDIDSTCEPNIQNANWDNPFVPDTNQVFGFRQIDFFTRYWAYAYGYRFVYPTIYYPVGTLDENNRATATYDADLTYLKSIKQNYLAGDGNPVVIGGESYDTHTGLEFNIPLIESKMCVIGERGYTFMGYLPVDCTIVDNNITNNTQTETTFTAYPSKYIDDDGNTEISYWYGEQAYKDGVIYRFISSQSGIQSDNPLGYNGVTVAANQYTDDAVVNNKVKNRRIRIDFNQNEEHQIIVYFRRHLMTQEYVDDGGHIYSSTTPNPVCVETKTTVGLVIENVQQELYSRLEDNIPLEIAFTFSYYPANAQRKALFKQGTQIDAYYLFTKAQLAVCPIKKQSYTPYYNTPLPFFVSENDKTLLQRTQLIESDFIGKNLWEVFSEIGKYIHAKPKVSFELDENYNHTGRFLVSFLQYGKPNINNIEETKNTIFNSKFAQEYIAELDNYVENYFNLGSYVSEYLHFTSDSDDDLIYNDVIKLKTKYPILEIMKLNLVNPSGVIRDITKYTFEWNIYKTLDYSETQIPSKNRAIYYHLGEQFIEGMQFVTPKSSGVECAYSIKNIIATEYNISPNNIDVNTYTAQIFYRVKDNVRVSITRPDLRKYLLNSKQYDSYPLHTQFNQQQDKIISSDSFGLNAYGKLIRTGNSTYSLHNWSKDINKVMNEGDLYQLEDDLYYVSKVNRVYYAEHIEETVELTKDFNRLSQIIGIPSQPRFYEISERNIINRDIKFNEYIMVSAKNSSEHIATDTILTQNGITAIWSIGVPQYLPDGVITIFKGDVDKKYPYDIESNNQTYQTFTPLVTYSSKNTLTLEWDMEDNYSAGDKAVQTGSNLKWGLNLYSIVNCIFNGFNFSNMENQAYQTKAPVRYVDVYGRADLVDFLFIRNCILSTAEIKDTPQFDIETQIYNHIGDDYNYERVVGGSNDEAVEYIRNPSYTSSGIDDFLSHYNGYIIAKDNRERLSFNYNIQLLLDSDRIVLGNKLWIRELTNSDLKIVLLDKELSKYDCDLVNVENIIASSQTISFSSMMKTVVDSDVPFRYMYLDIESHYYDFSAQEKTECKAYAVVRANPINQTNYRVIIGRNVTDILNLADKIVNFYFDAYDNSSAKTNRSQLDDIYNELYN